MKYEFSQIYEFPSSVPTAVVTFQDCEHYAHLHSDIETRFEIIDISENKCRQKIDYKWSFLEWSQITTVEYTPPATLTLFLSELEPSVPLCTGFRVFEVTGTPGFKVTLASPLAL